MQKITLKKPMKFYEEILGLERGRFTDEWVDYVFFGHQVVFAHGQEIKFFGFKTVNLKFKTKNQKMRMKYR